MVGDVAYLAVGVHHRRVIAVAKLGSDVLPTVTRDLSYEENGYVPSVGDRGLARDAEDIGFVDVVVPGDHADDVSEAWLRNRDRLVVVLDDTLGYIERDFSVAEARFGDKLVERALEYSDVAGD